MCDGSSGLLSQAIKIGLAAYFEHQLLRDASQFSHLVLLDNFKRIKPLSQELLEGLGVMSCADDEAYGVT